MKELVSNIACAFCIVIAFASCGKEFAKEDEFMMEVTINGKTYRADDLDSYGSWLVGDKWAEERLEISSFTAFVEQGFEIWFTIQHYADNQKLLGCPTGEYSYGQYIDENGEAIYLSENLAIDVEYDDPNMWARFYQGTHNVTSIKRTRTSTHSEAVAIEGTFSVIEEDKGLSIQGKYRIAVH